MSGTTFEVTLLYTLFFTISQIVLTSIITSISYIYSSHKFFRISISFCFHEDLYFVFETFTIFMVCIYVMTLFQILVL
jgi:hypothetical protein